jgi:hypothetical protein
MRMDFDSQTDPLDALHRVRVAKVPGRKHLHQPRGRAREKHRLHALNQVRKQNRQRAIFNALVAAYWRGELSSFPA